MSALVTPRRNKPQPQRAAFIDITNSPSPRKGASASDKLVASSTSNTLQKHKKKVEQQKNGNSAKEITKDITSSAYTSSTNRTAGQQEKTYNGSTEGITSIEAGFGTLESLGLIFLAVVDGEDIDDASDGEDGNCCISKKLGRHANQTTTKFHEKLD
eukprot:CAMPEP_0171634374 /NCGR_PEP_ID=MMETSP0990-20121206/25883_1 /TAXON_ID=483369 /ORGANISM="non described non described, Strain CCMP2098" /LENGTH=156 /DNA_ID=CAMNT_0012205515 /DNA_START=124 /DNA_END=594 /DNA_ORIENTATION=+